MHHTTAYIDGLKMLAMRELSEAQLRQRLARKGHEAAAIDDAIEQLRRERALDDARVAELIARRETSIRGRGKLRVRLQIERAGISQQIAARAAAAAFERVEEDTLLSSAIERRLRGRAGIESAREYARLYRYLLGQGFDPDRIRAALDRLRRTMSDS